MQQAAWFERKFAFPEENILPSVIERLENTPLRLWQKLKKIDPGFVRVKVDNKWSILEHVGHLGDLEPLWQGRLKDILNGTLEMREADLSNRKTDLANHNTETFEKLLGAFETSRKQTIQSLLTLPDQALTKTSLHPRLKTPMRIQDLFLFVAEHDDHHLAKITSMDAYLKSQRA
jgi:uncharacterized damage-inducible protein DinB